MKIQLLSITALVAAGLLAGPFGVLSAQPAGEPARAAAAASNPASPPTRGTAPPVRPALPPLKENVTLKIQGVFLEDTPVDIAWTGNGPAFAHEAVAPVEGGGEKTVRLSGNISEEGAGCRVEFRLLVAVPRVVYTLAAGRPRPVTSTTTYDNVGLSSSVLLKPGVPVVVFEKDDKKVTMTLGKPAP